MIVKNSSVWSDSWDNLKHKQSLNVWVLNVQNQIHFSALFLLSSDHKKDREANQEPDEEVHIGAGWDLVWVRKTKQKTSSKDLQTLLNFPFCAHWETNDGRRLSSLSIWMEKWSMAERRREWTRDGPSVRERRIQPV